jgi:small subunit ribosomal protein S19
MTRSKWKGPFIHPKIFVSTTRIDKLIPLKHASKQIDYFIWNRNSEIPAFFLNRRVGVHNGRKFLTYIIKKNMLGHKFGEFSITKPMGKKIHLKKKKKKRKLKEQKK